MNPVKKSFEVGWNYFDVSKKILRSFGLEDSIGTIEPGKIADLIIVNGNPLGDIVLLTDHQQIRVVMQGGRIVCFREFGGSAAIGFNLPKSAFDRL